MSSYHHHSTTPSIEHADPFGPSAAHPRRYVYSDNDSDNVDPYGRRDTYASDSSNNGLNDTERYYDHNGTYDPYGEHGTFSYSTASRSHMTWGSTTRYRFGHRRLWTWICTVCRVVGTIADGTIGLERHRIRRVCSAIWCQGPIRCLDDRAADTALQGRNRGHFPRPRTKVWFSTGLDAQHGLLFYFFLFLFLLMVVVV